jgi:segregation and condensation protein A
MEIVRPLTEYLQMKSAAEILAQRTLLGEGTFTRTSGEVRQLFTQDDQLIQIGLFELIDAFQQILTKIAPEERLDLTADRISVKDRIRELVDIFEKKQSLTFEELFSEHPNRSEVIVTFLAILEMVKLALIRLAQHSQTGVIRLFYQ